MELRPYQKEIINIIDNYMRKSLKKLHWCGAFYFENFIILIEIIY